MKSTFISILFSLTSICSYCQNLIDVSTPIYKNSYGELNSLLSDSIKFTSTKGYSKTIYLDKSMKSKNLILYKNLMLYADYGALFTFDFDQMKKDTILKSKSFIAGNQLLLYGDTLVVYNYEKLLIIDLISKVIMKEFIGDFSNAELANNQLFYSVIEENVETGVYQIDLNTNIKKKLLHIPNHTFSYGDYPSEKWSGMKVIGGNLFIHSDNSIYIIDYNGNNPVINFLTKFSGGVNFVGIKNDVVTFEDNGDTILVNLNTRKIKRKDLR